MSTTGAATKLPMRHLSIRVPWHDSQWNGTICKHPVGNAACLALSRIRENRDDNREEKNAGRLWSELPEGELPACVAERGGFMAPFSFTRTVTHPYVKNSTAHKHFAPTAMKYPAYAAVSIPFRWMLNDNTAELAERYEIGYRQELEEGAHRTMGFKTGWLQDKRNQLAMLDTFFSAVEPEKSLCFFYAKQTPLADETGRVIIGVGRVSRIGPSTEYEYQAAGELRSVLWERAVHHSIRSPEFRDGFLLPYHQLIELAETDDTIELADFVARAPEEAWEEFSYGAEHVSHDTAISSRLVCAEKLRKAAEKVPGNWEIPLRWIDDRLNELWRMRGPYPGLGSALSAFGIEHGNFLAFDIASTLRENEDP